MLRGTVFGVMLTVGAAYMMDSMASPESGQLVNWNVAGARAEQVVTGARDKVMQIIGEARASIFSPSQPQPMAY